MIPMSANDAQYLVGQADIDARPMGLYDDDTCAFLHDLSATLLKRGRRYPDVIAFAFWCRRANIQRLKAARHDIDSRVGRGLAFHIAPSNIPVNFAFSFAFSLLAGNANIVRAPSKAFEQNALLCAAISECLEKYPRLQARNAIVSYPRDNAVTERFSREADVRLIWGGDATIATLRGMQTRPRCVDVTFADRYSMAILDGEAMLGLDAAGLRALAEGFYNDTYLMDQNACSSPQLILWTHDSPAARDRFWHAVHNVAREKYALQPAIGADKYVQACEDILDEDAVDRVIHPDNFLYRVQLRYLPRDVERLRGKGGYFYECALATYDELADIITPKVQTLTYFGVNAEALRRFVVGHALTGIDRIVPVGAAMDIDVFWDGYDLVGIVSRVVTVQ